MTEEEGVGREFNILQNNGPLAHQVVGHVHFHVVSTDSLRGEGGGREGEWGRRGRENEANKPG